jgi:hypothetical protein
MRNQKNKTKPKTKPGRLPKTLICWHCYQRFPCRNEGDFDKIAEHYTRCEHSPLLATARALCRQIERQNKVLAAAIGAAITSEHYGFTQTITLHYRNEAEYQKASDAMRAIWEGGAAALGRKPE